MSTTKRPPPSSPARSTTIERRLSAAGLPDHAQDRARNAALSVTELTARIKQTLEQGFARVKVAGEVSRLTTPPSGHLYFTIKDAHAAISAVIWRSTLARLATKPEEGGEFVFSGHISVYEPRGSYQLIVNRVEPAGIGRLAAEFERRKQAFAARGWFDAGRKRKPPRLPLRIGIATSPNAAALEDVRKVLATRPGWLELLLSPCLVQGDGAPESIARALARLARARPDVVLLVRGGGSIEDLWCFNDERVVRAIAECPMPVITGIGHEIDLTLADLAADVRAATPSNAAEIVCPSREALRAGLPAPAQLGEMLARRIRHLQQRLALPASQLHAAFTRRMDRRRHDASRLAQRLHLAAARRLKADRARLRAIERRLAPLEPGARLRRQRQAWQQCRARLNAALPQRLLRREQEIARLAHRLDTAFEQARAGRRRALENARMRLDRAAERQTPARRQRLAAIRHRLARTALADLSRRRDLLARLGGKIEAMSPNRLLARGFTLCLDERGKVVTRAAQLHPGAAIRARFLDGEAEARVERIRLPQEKP